MYDNYTSKSDTLEAFTGGAQFASGSFRRELEILIDSGVRVSLVYGDAEYRTNCKVASLGLLMPPSADDASTTGLGGEAVSLALEHSDADQYVVSDVFSVAYLTQRGVLKASAGSMLLRTCHSWSRVDNTARREVLEASASLELISREPRYA